MNRPTPVLLPIFVGFVGLSLLAACGGKTDKSDAKPSASVAKPGALADSARPVVIEMGPDGKTKFQGGDMKGDAATCAAMKACCAASSDVGLFCGLSQATDGANCATVLKSTQEYLAERKLAKPAGCP